MKSTFILLLGMLCSIHFTLAQTTSNASGHDKDGLWRVLLELRNAGEDQVGQPLFKSVVAALEDLDAGQITDVHGDLLSEDLIKRIYVFVMIGKTDPLADSIKNACILINSEMTKGVEPQQSSHSASGFYYTELVRALGEIEETGSAPGVNNEGMKEVRRAFFNTKIALDAGDAELVISTGEIRFLKRMIPIVKDWGFKNAAQTMVYAIARASRKFSFTDEKPHVNINRFPTQR